jgi:hypothetical protein
VDQLSPEFLMFGLIWYGVFLFSTTCHEASHALVAKLGGDPTAFQGGQVTLNPAPHISREPFGMVLVPILSYVLGGGMIGWASAPYDPFWQQRYPRRAAWMSLAGPGANFTLAILAAIGIHIGIAAGIFQAPAIATFRRVVEVVNPETASDLSTFAAAGLSILFFSNVLLGDVQPAADAATRRRNRGDHPDGRTHGAPLSRVHPTAGISNGGHGRRVGAVRQTVQSDLQTGLEFVVSRSGLRQLVC